MKFFKIFLLFLICFSFLNSMINFHIENGRDWLDYIDSICKELGKEPIDLDFYNKAEKTMINDDQVAAFDEFIAFSIKKHGFYRNDSEYTLGRFILSVSYAEFIKWVLVDCIINFFEVKDCLPKKILKELDDFVVSTIIRNEKIINQSFFGDLDLNEKKIIIYVYILIFSGYLHYAEEVFFAYSLYYKNEGIHIVIKTKSSLKSWIKSFFHQL